MAKTAVNQFDTVPGNNTDVDGVGIGASMTVDNINDAMQHLLALLAQQMGEVGAMADDIASATTMDLSAARGWFVNITGTNSISSLGIVPAGKIFRLRFVSGLTLTYNAVSMILPNADSFAAAAGDIVTMLSLGSGNWRFIDYSPVGGAALPPGSMVDFGGTTAPTGWLLCNGQLISRTGYPLLFAAIGTAYSAGDGSTTFGVPDFRGRTAVGDDLMGTSAAGRITTATVNQTTRGGVGGAQTIALALANLAAHDHGGTTGSEAAHTHAAGTYTASSGGAHDHTTTDFHVGAGAQIQGGTNYIQTSTVRTTSTDGAHTHDVAGTSSAGSSHLHTIPSAGSGTAHNNMQPSLITMKIIKT